MCVFFLFLLVFLEGLEGRNFSVMYLYVFTFDVDIPLIRPSPNPRNLYFPSIFGVVEKWWVETRKCRPKIQLNHGKSASASPGRPRRSHPGGIDTFPHLGFEVRFGDQVYGVKLSPIARASSSSAYSDRVISLVSEGKMLSCFPTPTISRVLSLVCVERGGRLRL